MRYLILLAVLILSGCGQKGALYLPQEKVAAPQVEQSKSAADTSTTQGQP
ncbi:MAG: lipoprotein [Gammaproteobacteria bacterium]|nr:lipoprotein [Gammaproteobacteria bacterium]